MLFENENPYLDMILNLGTNEYLNKVEPSSKDLEKYLRGNMFDSEFIPYKNMTFKNPKISGTKEKELFEIMMYSFMINDYNLYLDLHPEDSQMYEKFKKAIECLDDLKEKYIKKYGPLEVCESNYPNYMWLKSSWPWDKKDGKYV